jgi:predicted O-methyltransferase YrrM
MLKKILIILISLVFSLQLVFAASPESTVQNPEAEISKYYSKQYRFQVDLPFQGFVRQIPVWKKILSPFQGKPNVSYLEIGVNQGRSALWVIENILTHPTATLTGIDIFPEGMDIKERYLYNLKLSGYESKAKTITGYSGSVLKTLPAESFDIIYIDGDHTASGVLSDAVLSWDLLKKGGVMIFDDYQLNFAHLPVELLPKIAIDSFITAYRNSLEVVRSDYQLFIKKRQDGCLQYTDISSIGCSPIGQYIYVWNYDKKNELYRAGDLRSPVPLTQADRALIEKLLRETEFGSDKLMLEAKMFEDQEFLRLREKLNLDMSNIVIKKEKSFMMRLRDLRDMLQGESR